MAQMQVDGAIAPGSAIRRRFRPVLPAKPDWALASPLGLIYISFFVLPLLILLWISFHNDNELTELGLENWQKFLLDPFYLSVMTDTLKLGLLTVTAATLLSYPIVFLFAEAGHKVRRIVLVLVALPLLTSVVVRTFAWIAILSREGVVNHVLQTIGLINEPLRLLQTEFGLILSLMQIEMPLMLLPLLAVVQRIDPRLIEASLALGASRWTTMWRVLVPLSLPGWIAGASLVFASSTTAFISQSVIGGGRLVYLPTLIWQQATVVYNWPFAAVVSIVLLVSVLAGILILAAFGRFVTRQTEERA